MRENAASTAGLLDEKVDPKNVIVFLVTLGVAVFGQILFRGFLSVIPILIAIIAGYVAAWACGLLDFTQVREAAFFALPNFTSPKFNFEAVMTIFPALLLVTSEHIGHQIVTGKIVGRNILERSRVFTDPCLRISSPLQFPDALVLCRPPLTVRTSVLWL